MSLAHPTRAEVLEVLRSYVGGDVDLFDSVDTDVSEDLS